MVDLDVSGTAAVIPVKPVEESSESIAATEVLADAPSSSSGAPVPVLPRAACLPLLR